MNYKKIFFMPIIIASIFNLTACTGMYSRETMVVGLPMPLVHVPSQNAANHPVFDPALGVPKPLPRHKCYLGMGIEAY
jgi:hypothetical protein